jgi:two-component system, NarL family, invasion response regulator UvrY
VETREEQDLSGILIVDDHPVIARACGHVFESIGIENVIAAGDVEAGFKAFIDHRPDLCVIDLTFHRAQLDGIALTRRIRSHEGTAKILIFTMRSDRRSFLSAIEAGATSYVMKDSPVHEFAKAVEATRSGRRDIDPQLALNLAFAKNAALSPRERQILDMLLDEDTSRVTSRLDVWDA